MSIDDTFWDTMETVNDYLEYKELTPDLENILVRMQIYAGYHAGSGKTIGYWEKVQALLTGALTTEQLKEKFVVLFNETFAKDNPNPHWNGWKFENTWDRDTG